MVLDPESLMIITFS